MKHLHIYSIKHIVMLRNTPRSIYASAFSRVVNISSANVTKMPSAEPECNWAPHICTTRGATQSNNQNKTSFFFPYFHE